MQLKCTANICLDLMSMHGNIRSSHLRASFLGNKSHICRGLEISELLHQSAKYRTFHTSHRQDPYRKIIKVLYLHKSNRLYYII